MEEQKYYTSFSQRRQDLRADWHKSSIKDWEQYVQLAEYRAIRVSDAINKSIQQFTHKEILNAYISLYRAE